jgi:hypothetical protein
MSYNKKKKGKLGKAVLIGGGSTLLVAGAGFGGVAMWLGMSYADQNKERNTINATLAREAFLIDFKATSFSLDRNEQENLITFTGTGVKLCGGKLDFVESEYRVSDRRFQDVIKAFADNDLSNDLTRGGNFWRPDYDVYRMLTSLRRAVTDKHTQLIGVEKMENIETTTTASVITNVTNPVVGGSFIHYDVTSYNYDEKAGILTETVNTVYYDKTEQLAKTPEAVFANIDAQPYVQNVSFKEFRVDSEAYLAFEDGKLKYSAGVHRIENEQTTGSEEDSAYAQ